MSENCGNCLFAINHTAGDFVTCVSSPPQIVIDPITNGGYRTMFPSPNSDQWCAEWQPRDEGTDDKHLSRGNPQVVLEHIKSVLGGCQEVG